MKLPLGFSQKGEHQVCKLNKSLYGLTQASRQQFLKFFEFLLTNGFIQSKADYTLFTKTTDKSFSALLVYVDNIILVGDNLALINDFKAIINQKFKIKDLGQLKYFLRLEVGHSPAGIHVCQQKFALDVLTDSVIHTPSEQNLKLVRDANSLLSDPTMYR